MNNNCGLDYGMGLTNIDNETGIRFGIISANDVGAIWFEEAEADYGQSCCPKCGNEVSEAKGEYRKYEHAKYECADYVCHTCKYVFGNESAFSEEALGTYYEKNGYKAFQSGNDNDIFIEKSEYYTVCAFCSPCAPGAGYIMDTRENGIKAYCFNHDFFENGIAPYPVFRVSDGTQVMPE